MPEFEAKLRKVGDSLGVLIPHQVVKEIHARAGQRVRFVIPPHLDLSEVYGKFRSERSTQDLLREARNDRD